MALFHLEIRVKDSARGLFAVFAQGAEDEAADVVFGDDDLDQPFQAIQKPMKRLYARDPSGGVLPLTDFTNQEPVCIEIGKRLFRKFFVGPAAARFAQYRQPAQRPRLALRLPPELYHLPWELLHDPDDDYGQFLSIQGSIIRCDAKTEPRLFNPSGESSFLFLLASPQDKSAIADFTLSDVEQFRFIKVSPPTYSNFQDLIKQPHFGLVFFGHGETDNRRHGRLIFVREDRQWLVKRWLSDPKYGHSLADAFGQNGEMRLACIFACESAWADKTVQFENSVVGACLRRTKLAFVLGAQTPLDLFASQECLAALLTGLAAGEPLDLALTKGRIAIRAMAPEQPGGQHGPMDWWVPVLYSKTTNLDILPKPPLVSIPEGLAKEALPLMKTPMALSSLSEAKDFMKAIGQKFAHVVSGENNLFRDI